MDKREERREPRLDDHQAAVPAQDAPRLGQHPLQVIGQLVQMMQATLHDEDVFALVRVRKRAAIADHAVGSAGVLRHQGWREVDTGEMTEAQALERPQAVAAPAKQLYDSRLARPGVGAKCEEAGGELGDLLLGGLKLRVGLLPSRKVVR